MPGSIFLYNGKVRSLTEVDPCAEAISICNGKVLRRGRSDFVRENLPTPVLEIDLQGKTVLPSFSDNLGCLGREIAARSYLDLSSARSMPEIFALIEQATRKGGMGGWITGFGWNKSQWGQQRFPHRADLDLVSPHHPVALLSADGRVAWVNSAGLSQSGIRLETPDPPGGEIQRDPITRAATGILLEKAVTLIHTLHQRPSPQEAQKALREIAGHYHSLGITSVGSFESLSDFRVIRDLVRSSDLHLDLTCHVSWPECEDLIREGSQAGQIINGLRIGGVWCSVDGALTSQTAWMKDPYVADWDKHGVLITPENELRQMVPWCLEHQFSPILQASGDAGCHLALQVLHTDYPRQGKLRAFIAHGDLVQEKDLHFLEKMNLGLITDPHRIHRDREAGEMCWGARWQKALDLKAWKERGVHLHFGSSGSIHHWSPMKALSSSLTPRTSQERHPPIQAEEGLGALIHPLCFQDGIELGSGTLSPGQDGNLVVLSGDPFTTAPAEIASIRVEMTVFHGEIVYRSNQGPEMR